MSAVHVQIGEISFTGNDDLDCPYLGWVRVVPDDGYIDVPHGMVTEVEDEGHADPASSAASAPPDGGLWLRIAFMGHVELTGYVTEVTLGGQPAFHVDLPEKLWGGNPHAWEEYSASALYSRRPVTEESVRKAWEAERARRAAWEARQQRYALEAADARDGEDQDDEDDDEAGTW